MLKKETLGQFEQLVLLAVKTIENAYAVPVHAPGRTELRAGGQDRIHLFVRWTGWKKKAMSPGV